MRTPSTYISETKKLNAVANDPTVPAMERILSLCRLYQWNQGDVHTQAQCVRRIEDIAKTK